MEDDCCGGKKEQGSCGACGDDGGCCKEQPVNNNNNNNNTTTSNTTNTTVIQEKKGPLQVRTDIDTAFDDLVFLEESIIKEGIDQGIEAGKRAGYQDAYKSGHDHGKEIGKEVGFYLGHVVGWKALMGKYPDLFSDSCRVNQNIRGQKTVKKLETLITNCTLVTSNENLHQQLEDIRTAYKLASSQLRSLYKKEEDGLSF